MVNTTPLALIAISAMYAILTLGIASKIVDALLTNLLQSQTISIIVEITGN